MEDEPTRQFIVVEFKENGRRYTYHNDFDPLKPGEKATVESPQNGPAQVTVVTVDHDKPEFPTKPIIQPQPESEDHD